MTAAGVLAAALIAGGPADGAGAGSVTIEGKAFTPPRITALAGDEVRWSNNDTSAHTVTAEDGSFDSGRLVTGDGFAHRFTRPGAFAYRCTLHRFMRGTVEVVGLALTGPAEPVAVGRTAALDGRSPRGGDVVTLERLGHGRVATTTARPDGRFSFSVAADAPAAYRAATADLTSAAVAVAVAPEVVLAARRGPRGSVSVRVAVSPPQVGAKVVLERHERERFGYVRLRAARLDRGSRARIVLHTARRLRLRARLALPVDGYGRSTSRVLVVSRRSGGGRRGHGHH